MLPIGLAMFDAVLKTLACFMQFGDGPEAERDPMQTDIPDGHTEVPESFLSQCWVTTSDMRVIARIEAGMISGAFANAQVREGPAEPSDRPRMTTRFMTKYERARILGTRALQIR
jgi:RNA polymerase Rpb6